MNVTQIALRSIHFYFARIISIVKCRKVDKVHSVSKHSPTSVLNAALFLSFHETCLGSSHPLQDYGHLPELKDISRNSLLKVCSTH